MTNTDKLIDAIRKHGARRTPDLEKDTGIDGGTISAFLKPAVDSGYLVACKVERPSGRPCNEYRLSAQVSESKVTWEEYRARQRIERKELKPQRQEDPSIRRSIAKSPTMPTQEKQTPIVVHNPATPAEMTPKIEAFDFWLDRSGQMVISTEEGAIELSPDRVRELGQFMVDTEPAWS